MKIKKFESFTNEMSDDEQIIIESVSAESILKQILKKNKRFKWIKDDLPKNFSKAELKDALTKAGYGKEYGAALKDLNVEAVNEKNMSYVRFENTYNDLQDCYENMEEASSKSEKEARRSLVSLCQSIADEYGSMYGEDSEIDEDDD